MSEFREQMDAEQFAIWLNGYLAARPDLANDEIHDQLERVVGGIVKRKLLGPSWILRPNEATKQYQPIPFQAPGTADPPAWTNTVTCAAGMLAGAQCDEEQNVFRLP